MADFQELRVWHRAVDLAAECYSFARSLPDSERFGLQAQIRRAAVSIPSNIAEGAGRRTRGDFRRFLRIAYGSACEIQTQVILTERLEIGDRDQAMAVLANVRATRRMLSGLIRSLDQ